MDCNGVYEYDACDRDSYHLTETAALVGELGAVLLRVLPDPAVHLLPLDLLLPAPEGRPALHHLEDETAHAPPVRTEVVPLAHYHFRGYTKHTHTHTCISSSFFQMKNY